MSISSKNIVLALSQYEDFLLDNSKVEFIINGENFKFSAIAENLNPSNRFVVFLNGALNTSKRPIFNRWSWGSKLDLNYLCIEDPFVRTSEGIGLNWYVDSFNGTSNDLVRFLDSFLVANDIKVEDVIFYGSSGGGYAAYMFSLLYPGSGSISINMQTDPKRYFKSYVEKYISIRGEEVELPDAAEFTLKSGFFPRSLVLQNLKDYFHCSEHFSRLLHDNSKGKNKNLPGNYMAHTYNDDDGHSGVPLIDSVLSHLEQVNSLSFPSEIYVRKNQFVRLIPFNKRGLACYSVKIVVPDGEKAIVFYDGERGEELGFSYSEKVGFFKYFVKSGVIEFSLKGSILGVFRISCWTKGEVVIKYV